LPDSPRSPAPLSRAIVGDPRDTGRAVPAVHAIRFRLHGPRLCGQL